MATGCFRRWRCHRTPGYSVIVSKPGFAEFELAEIDLVVGQEQNVYVTLTISPSRTRISVDASAPVAEIKTEISSAIRNSQILNLPVNGRRADTYALMTPAVVPDGVQGLISFRGIAGGNAFLTDGNDTSNQFFHENAGRTQDLDADLAGCGAGVPGSGEQLLGGVRAGVGRHHQHGDAQRQQHAWSGTAYLFFRNRGLNARDRYSDINPPERRIQDGGEPGRAGGEGPRLLFLQHGSSTAGIFRWWRRSRGRRYSTAAGEFVGSLQRHGGAVRGGARSFCDRQFQVLRRSADSDLAFGKLDWSRQRPEPLERELQLPEVGIAERLPDAGGAQRRAGRGGERQLVGADALWAAGVDV